MSDDVTNGQLLETARLQYAKSSRDADSLKVRLETDDIKLKIGCFLTGSSVVTEWDEKNQCRVEKVVKFGQPKVNKQGYQDIMSFVEAVVNKAVVMGNFSEVEDAYDYLTRIRRGFVRHLFINALKYGIRVEEMRGMVNTIFALIEPFITRTIKDGERGTIRETTVQQDRVIHGDGKLHFNPLKMFSSN